MDHWEILMIVAAGALLALMSANRNSANKNVNAASTSADTDGLDPLALRPLSINRASQIMNAAGSYKVYVDGELKGKVASGGSLTVQVPEECNLKLLAGKNGASMRIRTGKNAAIDFTTKYGGSIEVSPRGVQVLSIVNEG